MKKFNSSWFEDLNEKVKTIKVLRWNTLFCNLKVEKAISVISKVKRQMINWGSYLQHNERIRSDTMKLLETVEKLAKCKKMQLIKE